MKYVGSKAHLSKQLVPIIESYLTNSTTVYIEPFVGGANMIDKVRFGNKVGYDINRYVITLLNYIKNSENGLPPQIDESTYKIVKTNPDNFDDWFVGLCGIGCSFGAKWFGGYARSFKNDGVTPRNHYNENIRHLEKQRSTLTDITFIADDYRNIPMVENAVIYCDPPYRNSLQYKDKFDHDEFYIWCGKMAKSNIILVSEYFMPEQFEEIWHYTHKVNFDSKRNNSETRTEKLFLYKG